MSDKTVIFPEGCHPQITRDCCVVYEQARVVAADSIRAAVEGGALMRQPDLDPFWLSKAQEGLFESLETSDEVLDYCKDLI